MLYRSSHKKNDNFHDKCFDNFLHAWLIGVSMLSWNNNEWAQTQTHKVDVFNGSRAENLILDLHQMHIVKPSNQFGSKAARNIKFGSH